MAEKQFIVRLTANVAQFRSAMQQAKQETDGVGKSGTERFQQLGQAATVLGRQLTTRVTLPLIAVGVGAVKTAVDFDTSMTKIQALVGLSASEVDGMRDSVRNLSGQTAQSPVELANALFFITSAGLSGSEALEVLESSAKASAVGLGNTATIADLVTSAMNAYGSDVLSAAKATDDLTMAVRLGKLEPDQLAGAMGRVLPLSSAMGVGFEEVAAAMAAMSRTGTGANEAATQLRGIFATLLSPTQQAREAMSQVGLSVEGVQQSLRDDGLLATLALLVESFDGNASATEAVFGNIRALSGVIDMLGANVDGTIMIFDQMSDTAGVTDEAFAIMSETVGFKMKQAWTDLQVALLAIGDVLIPIVARFADAVSALFNAFSSLPGPVIEMLTVMGAIAAAIGPLLMGFGALVSSAVALKGAMIALKTAMISHPILALATVLAGVGVAFLAARENAEEFKGEMRELAEQIDEFGRTNVLRGVVEDFVASNSLLKNALDSAGISMDSFFAALMHGGEAFDYVVGQLQDEVTPGFWDLDQVFAFSRDSSTELAAALDELSRIVNGVDEAHRDLNGELAQTGTGARNAAREALGLGRRNREVAESVDDQTLALQGLERQLGFIPDAFKESMGSADAFEVILNTALNEVNRAAEDLRRRVDDASQSIISSFFRLSSDGKKNIDDFVNETIGASWRLAAFQNNVVTIAAATSGDFALHLYEMGEDVEGLVSDMADPAKAGDLQRAFDAWVTATGTTQRDMAEEIAKVDPAFQKTLQGVAALTQAELLKMNAVARLESAKIGAAIMQGQAQGISATSPMVQQAIRTAVRAAIDAGKAEAGISSPSQVMAQEVGMPMADGIIQGLEDSIPRLIEEMERVIEEARRTAVRAAEDMVRDVEQATSGLWRQVDDQRRLVELEESVAEAEKQLAEAKNEAAVAAKEYGKGSKEHQRALENVERATKRLEDSNYRLLRAMADAFEAGEISEEQFRATAKAAGLEGQQINQLVKQYERLRQAKKEAAREQAAAEKQAQYMAHRLVEFEALRGGGWFSAEELNHLKYLRDNHTVEAAQQYLLALIYQAHTQMQAGFATPPGRLHGGPVARGSLYEVTEDGVGELLQMGSRQYLIPGQSGRVVPLSQAANINNVSNSSATTTVTLVNNRKDLTPADVSMALAMSEVAA